MNDDDEYELLPLTVELMKTFEAKLEIFQRNESPEMFETMAEKVHNISDFEKGRVIIDLMVLLATAMRSLTDRQLPKLED